MSGLSNLYRNYPVTADNLRIFPLLNFTNKASDVFKKVIADIKDGYGENIHPDLVTLYKENYQRSLAMFGNPKPDEQHFGMYERFKLNESRLATYKAHHVTKALQGLPVDGFDKRAMISLKQFNRWQITEYNTMVARARTAKQFEQFKQDADLYPCLEWLPTRSADPRDEHVELVGTVLPIDDPFWNENQPGNLWNCKCDWKQVDKPVNHNGKTVTPATGLEGNPAETGELITDKHPYVAKTNVRVSRLIEDIFQPIIKSLNIFLGYDDKWKRAIWNSDNGGFNVYHKQHQFSGKGGKVEKIIGEELAVQGKQVEFLKEQKHTADINFDKMTWEIKSIAKANETTIRSYIKDSRKGFNAIFYVESKSQLLLLRNALNREKGRFISMGMNLDALPNVYYMINKKLKKLWVHK